METFSQDLHFSLDVVKALLNQTNACVSLTDADTKKVLFVNEKMEEEYDYIYNENSGRHYKQIDSLIMLDNGVRAQIHHFFDITQLKLEQESLRKQVHAQKLLRDISMNFACSVNYEDILHQVLAQLGIFFHSNFVMILKYEQEKEQYVPLYKWDPEGSIAGSLGVLRCAELPEAFQKMRHYHEYTVTSEEFQNLTHHSNMLMNAIGSHRWIAAPISPEYGHFGILLVSRSSKYTVPQAFIRQEHDLLQTVCGIISAGVDRKHLDQEFLKAKKVLFDVIDNVPSRIYWKDTNNRYRGCNKLFAEDVGIQVEDLVGKTDAELSQICRKEAITDEMLQRFSNKENDEDITLILGEGKRRRWYSCRRINIEGNQSGGLSILGVVSDVTDKAKAEIEMQERGIQLKEALRIAEASDSAKTDFLSRMSHEIRTPMNAIIGMSHIALASEDMNKVKLCISKIDSASDQLLCIINDILDMSKIESGKMDIVHEPFDLEKMLEETCDIVAVKADEHKQNLRFEIGREVPLKLKGDEFRISQVITNLVTNAVKFTPDGGDIQVKVKAVDPVTDTVELSFSVVDTGIGISRENQKKLFDAFEQLNGSASRKYGGTGLGLAICKRIVELMGGQIGVQSIEGKGSTFTFTVRLEVLEPRDMDIALPEFALHQDLKVLFVNDDEETRQYFKDVMDQHGMQVDCAKSGQDALALLAKAQHLEMPYSIIFIDYHMPEMNGIQVARQMKEQGFGGNYAIVVSLYEWSQIEGEAAQAGIDKFLSKPFFPSQIIEVIQDILGTPTDKVTDNKNEEMVMPDFHGKRILVAEDVEVNRDIIAALLEPTKVEIMFAVDGKIAVEMIKAEPNGFDLILMDVDMPVLDGYNATKAIRKLAFDGATTLPIVAMTANVFSDDVNRCINAGMNAHIGKPIDEKTLMMKLHDYLKDGGQKAKDDIRNVSEQINDHTRYLPYIDTENALSRVRGNQKLFLTMLRSYRNGAVFDNLIRASDAGDLEKALYYIQTLKGVAGNLSLSNILEVMMPFEGQLRLNALQKELLPDLKEAVEKTNQYIDALLKDWEWEETQS